MGDDSLQDSVALVTGASTGIGRESARKLAREGASVALAARREKKLHELASSLTDLPEVETAVLPTDVTDEEQVARMVDETVDAFGKLDVVVNNAGLIRPGPVEEMSTEDYQTMMGVNVNGMFYTTRAVLPHLRRSSGVLVFMGSFAGQYPRPGNPVYAASKWWTRGFAMSLAGEVGHEDIGISVVNPTEVYSEFGRGGRDNMNKERLNRDEVTDPADVAEAVVFAAKQNPPNTLNEIDIYRRDKFTDF